MTWSSRHQLAIIAVIAAIILVYVGIRVAKYVHRASVPTCSDNRQNGDERGVDCGGSCQKICPADVQPLRIVWERPIIITDTTAAAVAMIENPNTNYALPAVSYTVKLYDAAGILANEPFVGETFIEPNTQTVLYMPPVRVGSIKPVTAHFELQPLTDYRSVPQSYGASRIGVVGYSFTDEATRPVLTARLSNPTTATMPRGTVLAIIYDASGNIINASQTLLPSITARKEITVTFTWPMPFDKQIGRVEIIPRVSPFSFK